jgi:hypothetical protein
MAIYADPDTRKEPYLSHEIYLENKAKAQELANPKGFEDQRLLAKREFHTPDFEAKLLKTAAEKKAKPAPEGPPPTHVFIVVDKHSFRTLYQSNDLSNCGRFDINNKQDDEQLDPLSLGAAESITLPEGDGIPRETLMICSTVARDFFETHPTETELHLPIKYPRRNHRFEIEEIYIYQYFERNDPYMAHINPAQIRKFIIPWIFKVDKARRSTRTHKTSNGKSLPHLQESDIPKLEIPTSLLDKIHLYNAAQQLGLPRFAQLDLTRALCKQLHSTRLTACELELQTLEMTVARFYSEGIAVLDPVISCLVGSYGLRDQADREDLPHFPRMIPDKWEGHSGFYARAPESTLNNENTDGRSVPAFEYTTFTPGRRIKRSDTAICPPPLQVLGHCMRHWSGVGVGPLENKVAYQGYPLHIGKMKYYKTVRPEEGVHSTTPEGDAPWKKEEWTKDRLQVHRKYDVMKEKRDKLLIPGEEETEAGEQNTSRTNDVDSP